MVMCVYMQQIQIDINYHFDGYINVFAFSAFQIVI